MRAVKNRAIGILMIMIMLLGVIPVVYGQSFPYTVSGLKFTDGNGIPLATPEDKFDVAFTVKKVDNAARGGIAIISVYGKNGELLCLLSENVTAEIGKDQLISKTVAFSANEQAKEAKAYVWQSFASMKPLSLAPSTKDEKPTVPKGEANYFLESFSDVSGTETYAEAVSLLSEIGVMGGYADGAFYPEDKITRADAALIAIKMLKKESVAKILNATSDFTDVIPGTELCGAINYCTSMEMIKSIDAQTFSPDGEFTYVQLVKLLVETVGYRHFAEAQGGWPVGYISVADSNKIIDGITATAYQTITRAQMAQGIYNTLFVPIAEVSGTPNGGNVDIYTIKDLTTIEQIPNVGSGGGTSSGGTSSGGSGGSGSGGGIVAKPPVTESSSIPQVQDGKDGKSYTNLLIRLYGIYYVEGYVSNTNKSMSSVLKKDEVEFRICFTENYKNTIKINSNRNAFQAEKINVGKTSAKDNLFVYGKALIRVDEIGNETMIRFRTLDRNNVATSNAKLIDRQNLFVFDEQGNLIYNPYISYFESKNSLKSQKYVLDRAFRVFVNEAEITNTSKMDFEKYVVNNTFGEVKLIDVYPSDGYYDAILVTNYATAQIGQINPTTEVITFQNSYNSDVNKISLLDTSYNIFRDGRKIGFSDLQIGDIISIQYDVNVGMDITDFYEIYVSRNTHTGKYTNNNNVNETVTIGDKNFEFVAGYGEAEGLQIAERYALYLDAFGRIAGYEKKISADGIAIIDGYTKSASDDYYRAMLYTSNGEKIIEEVDTSKITSIIINGISYTGVDNINNALKKFVYSDVLSGVKNPIQERVVKYKTSSVSNKITALEVVNIEKHSIDMPFNSRSNTIGTIKVCNETKVIDAVYYEWNKELDVTSIVSFADNEKYEAYGYGERDKNGSYYFVIVTSAPTGFNPKPIIPDGPEQLGIIEKYTKASIDDYWRALIYTTNGTTEGLEIDTSEIRRITIGGKVYTGAVEVNNALKKFVYIDNMSGKKTNIQDRVVKYRVSPKTGRVVSLEVVSGDRASDTFVKNTSSIGNIKMNDATKVVDAIGYATSALPTYTDLDVTSLASFADNENYTAYAYGAKDINGIYNFVIVTSAPTGFNPKPIIPDGPEQLGIIEKYTKTSIDDYWRALIYTTNGTAEGLEIDTSKITSITIGGKVYTGAVEVNNALEKLVYIDNMSGKKTNIQDRVVKYKISQTTGRVVSLEVVSGDSAFDTFVKNTSSVGNIKMNDATKVVDAIDYYEMQNPLYSDLLISSLAGFVDTKEYTIYAYGNKGTDGAYPLVLVIYAGGYYDSNTMFAVLKETPSQIVDTGTGDNVYILKTLYNNEEITLVANNDVSVNNGGITIDAMSLERGDVIVFVKDIKGNVKKIDVLISADALGISRGYSGVAETLTRVTDKINPPQNTKNWTGAWTASEDDNEGGNLLDYSKPITRLVFGPIVDKKNYYFQLGSVGSVANKVFPGETRGYTGFYTNKAEKSGIGGAIDINITPQTKTYIFDYRSDNIRTQLAIGSTADIRSAPIAESLLLSDLDVIPWSKIGVADGANFAFAKVVDEIATEVFVILSK